VACSTSSEAGWDCQKFFISYGQPAADIAREKPARTLFFPRRPEQPAALRIRALLNLETVGVRLHQLVESPKTAQLSIRDWPCGLKLSLVEHALAGKLRGGRSLHPDARRGANGACRGGAGGGQHARSLNGSSGSDHSPSPSLKNETCRL